MARSIEQIEQQMIDQKNSYQELSDINSDSKTAKWRLWIRIVSTAIWVFENVFDLHKRDTDNTIAQMKPHSLRWYYNKVGAFQFGHQLAENGEADYYDNTNRTEDEVAEAKIIKFRAIEDDKVNRELLIKVAAEGGVVLTSVQEQALASYLEHVKDAGVYFSIVNRLPDKIKLGLTIIYDPLYLSASGLPLSGGSVEPVRTAVDAFLSSLDFNATLVLKNLVDSLSTVPGVRIPVVTNAQYLNENSEWVTLSIRRQPFSGRFTYMDGETNNLVITYEPDYV